MEGDDRLNKNILKEYKDDQLLKEVCWAQKAVDESEAPQPEPDELDKIMNKIEHGHDK